LSRKDDSFAEKVIHHTITPPPTSTIQKTMGPRSLNAILKLAALSVLLLSALASGEDLDDSGEDLDDSGEEFELDDPGEDWHDESATSGERRSRLGDLSNPDSQEIHLIEDERIEEYHARNYTWPVPEYTPNTR
jgi:hypothetical protein